MTGGSPALGWTEISRIGTRMPGWIRPGLWTFLEAGSSPVVTVGVRAFMVSLLAHLQRRPSSCGKEEVRSCLGSTGFCPNAKAG